MPGTVRFQYDVTNDIHLVYPKWDVETEEDCRVWFGQFEAYFSPFGRQVDVIIVLDDFRIGPKIGSVWGKYRSAWVSKYTRYSVRVRSSARARTFSFTSAALHGGSYEEAPDVESAVERIRGWRKEEARSGKKDSPERRR